MALYEYQVEGIAKLCLLFAFFLFMAIHFLFI